MLVIAVILWYPAAGRATKHQQMEPIKVAPEGQGFVELESGRPYIPFGTNYYDPNTG